MNELKGVMEVNQHQLSELERHLEAFKDMRDKALLKPYLKCKSMLKKRSAIYRQR